MCGVFAYSGKKNTAAKIILEGLKTLEYRGYDSWGIAVQNSDRISLEKHVGKIGSTKIHLQKSVVGIGHTRWATHGGVTVENAHPHLDCSKTMALLHNGIIENFAEIKKSLRKHTFHSETDTEVIIHLIEELRERYSFRKSVQKAFLQMKGLNALVVLDNSTGEIIAVKNGSPLVVGIGKGEYFIASDITGILPYTKDVIFLKDNEMVHISSTLAQIQLPSGKEIKPTIETISWNIKKADKGKFKYFMLKEILEQPGILESLGTTSDDRIETLASRIRKARGTFLIGAGTAYHACLAGAYLFSKLAKRHVNTVPASEFNYLEDFLTKESLIIALSQSGETIDVIEPITRAKGKESAILGILNALGSTLYRMSDDIFLIGAGPEKAVASTKVYTAKLATEVLLAYALAGKLEQGKHIISQSAKEAQRLVNEKNITAMKKLAKKLLSHEHMYTIGRGLSYPSALEAALKIKEVSYIHAEGLAGGELKHGPIALIEKGTPCIVFAPSDETYDAIISNATEIKARGGYMIGIGSDKSPVFDEWIEIKDTGVGSIITSIIPIQLLSYFLAIYKKLDPDKPRNLAKSVTVK